MSEHAHDHSGHNHGHAHEHSHTHHDHGHDNHSHAPAAIAARAPLQASPRFSLMLAGAGGRLALAFGALALLWPVTLWALR